MTVHIFYFLFFSAYYDIYETPIVCCYISLYVVISACMLLYQPVCCYISLYVVISACMLLYQPVCCYISLYVVISACMLLYLQFNFYELTAVDSCPLTFATKQLYLIVHIVLILLIGQIENYSRFTHVTWSVWIWPVLPFVFIFRILQ